MIDQTEARLVMLGGVALGLFVTGYSVYGFLGGETPVETPAADLNAQPLDAQRTDLRLMRWPGWVWLLTVTATGTIVIGYLVLGAGVDVPENRLARRRLAAPLFIGICGLWWLGRNVLKACGVQFFAAKSRDDRSSCDRKSD